MDLLMLVASVAALVVGACAAGREWLSARRELPLHVALRRFEVGLEGAALRSAEARCGGCALRRSCMRGLVRYQDLPASCPNRHLLALDQGRPARRA